MILNRKPDAGLIGVDIGTHLVKLAQVCKTIGGFALQSAIAVPRYRPWPADLAFHAGTRSTAGELNVARSLDTDFVGQRAAGTMTMAACDVRKLELPSDLEPNPEFIAAELSAIDRFKGEHRQFDSWEDETHRGNDTSAIHVLSLPQAWANQFAGDLRESGLDCEAVDGIPFAMARSFSAFEGSNLPVALLDWGYSRATFCVLQHGRPRFIRMLRKCGFGNVVQAVCDNFGVELLEARRVICDYGIPNFSACEINLPHLDEPAVHSESPSDRMSLDARPTSGAAQQSSSPTLSASKERDGRVPDFRDPSRNRSSHDSGSRFRAIQQTISNVVIDQINCLVKEVQRTLRFIDTQPGIATPNRMVLFGGGATLKNIGPLLTEKLEMWVAPWQAPINHIDQPSISLPLFGNAISMSLMAWEHEEVGTA